MEGVSLPPLCAFVVQKSAAVQGSVLFSFTVRPGAGIFVFDSNSLQSGHVGGAAVSAACKSIDVLYRSRSAV